MDILTGRRMGLGVAAAMMLAGAGAANATLFTWNFNAGDPQPPGGAYESNTIGGTVHSLTASFNTVNRQLSFTANFADRVTTGYFLAMNNGPIPRSRPGQLGLFYFDAGDVFDADPSTNTFLTAYGYNGANNGSTWRDGDSVTPGDQAPDLIRGILDTSWITSLTAANVVLPGGVNGRSFTFVIDATSIINHVPLYPDPMSPWYGTGFDTALGIWFHPFADLFEMTYNAQGGIGTWNYGPQGSFDGHDFQTPAPSSFGIAALAVGFMGRRRRRR